jgi:hypothetical protein
LLKIIRRLEKSIYFINECLENRKTPIFAKIGKSARRKLLKCKVSPKNIKKMERTNVLNEKRKNTGTMYNLQSEVNLKFEKLRKIALTLILSIF